MELAGSAGAEQFDADVIIIGGGPAGSTLGTLLAQNGRKALIIEKDIHPRDHVGESLVPSTNLVFNRIGFLDKLNDAGFIPKPGTGWNGPRSPIWKFVEIPLFEIPIEGNTQNWTFHVERDAMDTMLLRHAHDNGARVLQGVKVTDVLFEGGRAVGVRAQVADGWERELRSKIVVDASGRRCMLATRLGMKRKDRNFNQFCIYSWFRNVKRPPDRHYGWGLFYFLGMNQAWGWQFSLRGGKESVGIVVDKEDFQKSGQDEDNFFSSLVKRSRQFTHVMQDAERIRPYWVEGDYSYKIDRYAGPGWLMVGDALRFVDPIFSSGVDVALFSALYAYEAIEESWRTGNEEGVFDAFHDRINLGVDSWYDTISLFYKLQNLLTRYAVDRKWRPYLIRALQGAPYNKERVESNRKLQEAMQASFDRVMTDPESLLRPWAMDPEKDRTLTCPTCLGVADYWEDEQAFVCRRCGARTEAKGARFLSDERNAASRAAVR
ncbi:MAG: NAD(P)/FAD-dependent oxidoreductase [Actinobacteria bacterium]|nr:MAG: NAD(P)/FAD-dependent oxidoreductase [Actinomycetota bacterium]